MKKIILILALMMIPSGVWGACSWSGNTGTVDVSVSYTYADVQDCITDASALTGVVTIQIPDSTLAAASNAITVNMRTGFANVTELIIKGQNACTLGYTTEVRGGVPTACTTILSAFKLLFYGSPAKKFRLSNVAITGSTNTTTSGIIQMFGDTNYTDGGGFRIDHIFFNETNHSGTYNFPGLINVAHRTSETYSTGLMDGVIDHVYSYKAIARFLHTQPVEGAASTTNREWIQPIGFGSSKAIFIEDCKVYSEITALLVESQGGGRVVLRRNYITNAWVGGHDAAIGNFRGIRKYEVYNNTFIADANFGTWAVLFTPRSGNGVFYNNTIDETASANPTGYIMSVYVSRDVQAAGTYSSPWDTKPDNDGGKACLNSPISFAIRCDEETDCGGTNGVTGYCVNIDGDGDGGALPDGYPARDQLGVLQNSDGSQTGGGMPYLVWGNTLDGSASVSIRNQSLSYIVADRDYCATTSATMPATCNSVTTTYAPYVYPHPLQGTVYLYLPFRIP